MKPMRTEVNDEDGCWSVFDISVYCYVIVPSKSFWGFFKHKKSLELELRFSALYCLFCSVREECNNCI